MLRRFFPFILCAFLFSSCTGLKQLGSALNKQSPALAASQDQSITQTNSEIKFLNDISGTSSPAVLQVNTIQSNGLDISAKVPKIHVTGYSQYVTDAMKEIVVPAPIQIKYAEMLGTDAAEIQNLKLFEFIDDWYGTRYRMGGASKKGIDCSALVQLMYSDIYYTTVPRTSKEQFRQCRRISTTELQEGDLVFFHTRGRGVSHVGIYLQNNKFVHASRTGGVMISDMYEDYFVKRLVGAGRMEL